MASCTAPNPAAVSRSDEQLLVEFKAGENGALEALFDRYRGLAYRVAQRLLGNEADSLDAVQEGFIKALTHLDGFEGRSSFKTWLLRIVSNAALDLGRSRSRREALSLDALRHADDPPEAAVDAPPGLDLDRGDLQGRLYEALGELPEAQRRTFILHVEAQLSYREVAETLEISIGTVMSRLFYARQKLKTLLADHLPG